MVFQKIAEPNLGNNVSRFEGRGVYTQGLTEKQQSNANWYLSPDLSMYAGADFADITGTISNYNLLVEAQKTDQVPIMNEDFIPYFIYNQGYLYGIVNNLDPVASGLKALVTSMHDSFGVLDPSTLDFTSYAFSTDPVSVQQGKQFIIDKFATYDPAVMYPNDLPQRILINYAPNNPNSIVNGLAMDMLLTASRGGYYGIQNSTYPITIDMNGVESRTAVQQAVDDNDTIQFYVNGANSIAVPYVKHSLSPRQTMGATHGQIKELISGQTPAALKPWDGRSLLMAPPAP